MGGGSAKQRPAGYSTAAKQRTAERAEKLLQAVGKATKLSHDECGKAAGLAGIVGGLVALKWALKHKGWFEEKAGFWVLSAVGKQAFFGVADRGKEDDE